MEITCKGYSWCVQKGGSQDGVDGSGQQSRFSKALSQPQRSSQNSGYACKHGDMKRCPGKRTRFARPPDSFHPQAESTYLCGAWLSLLYHALFSYAFTWDGPRLYPIYYSETWLLIGERLLVFHDVLDRKSSRPPAQQPKP